MSWAQFGLGIAVFGGLDYVTKLKRIRSHPELIIWIGFYGLFLISGLTNKGGNAYYLDDIRTKMPLWVIPAAVGLMPALKFRDLQVILHVFLASLCIASVVVIGIRLGYGIERAEDFRDFSPFVSHIRLAICLVLGIFISVYLITADADKIRYFRKILYYGLSVFLFVTLLMLNSFTAWPVLFGAFSAFGVHQLLKVRSKKIRLGFGIGLLLLLILGLAYPIIEYQEYRYKEPIPLNPEKKTFSGNLYTHDPTYPFYENGRAVGMYISETELRETWRKRSKLNPDSLDLRGQPMMYTLKRYLTSRGLRKDREGVEALSEHDIQSIENGYANYLYAEPFAIRGRLREIFWEFEMYRSSKDPNNKSLSTRLELWRASVHILAENPLGIGAGNVRKVLERQLEEQHSGLRYFGNYGPHNQYLATALALGIPGIIWMILCILMPLLRVQRILRLPAMICLGILATACLTEDMFETQTAVTFSVFWIVLWNGVGKETAVET